MTWQTIARGRPFSVSSLNSISSYVNAASEPRRFLVRKPFALVVAEGLVNGGARSIAGS